MLVGGAIVRRGVACGEGERGLLLLFVGVIVGEGGDVVGEGGAVIVVM